MSSPQHGPRRDAARSVAPPRASGAIARLQRALTFGLLALAAGWALVWWSRSAFIALAGAVALALSHAGVLALEFAAAWRVNAADPAPRASAWAMARAWLAECGTTPRVFYWRQPFFSSAVPDQFPQQAMGRRGVVLVHGFACNRGFWNPWLKRLRDDGRAFAAPSLEPVTGSIEGYRAQIDDAVRRVTAATGLPPLLVCHSMGGLAVRAWLKRAGDAAPAQAWRVVTIASPHRGTWLGRFSLHDNGRQMNLESGWLARLRAGEPAARNRLFICWYSNCDNIVFPASSATLPNADNRFVAGVPHVALAFRPEVMRATFALLNSEAVCG